MEDDRATADAAPPLISVVMASFNAEAYVRNALESAISNGPESIEILVQDGASTDGTAAAIEAVGDPRTKFVSEPDEGQSDALNRALGRARGEWVVWLNADDMLAPDWFASVEPFLTGEVDIVYGDFAYIDHLGQVTRTIPVAAQFGKELLLARGQYLFSGATIFRRSLFERFGSLDTGLRIAMDYDFFLRIAADARAVHCGATLAYFRRHGDSISTDISWPLVRENARVRRRHGGYRSLHTAIPIAWNEVKQVIDVMSLPVRKAARSALRR
jgi:glycosyltransferase involved in cell wall biosynthesis